MSDDLLPTPTAWQQLRDAKKGARSDLLPGLVEDRRTSASSPGSEGSTSPPRPTVSPASDRSSGTPTAPESSSDGGRLFPDGEMSPGSALLPTPTANDLASGMTPERWDEWTEEMRERHRNGNSHGKNLGIEIKRRTSSLEASPASPPPPLDAARAPRTIAGSGRSSPVSLGSWDPDTSSWRTSQASLLSTEDERFPRSWETWPRSGMTRRGQAFALPMSARVTGASGSSSSLGTPEAHPRTHSPRTLNNGAMPLANQVAMLHTPTGSDTNPSYDHRASPGYTRAKPVPNLAAQVDELLPTPVADHSRGLAQTGTDFQSLPNAVLDLLPTPKSNEATGPGDHGTGGADLRTTVDSLGEPTPEPSSDGSES
jgi:hypothetical protein